MIVITDLQGGGWDDWKFKSKKDLKNFLQSESCNNQVLVDILIRNITK
jgi:hypothetical protein